MSAIEDLGRRLSGNCGHVSLPPLVCNDCRNSYIRGAAGQWDRELNSAAREQNARMSEELAIAHGENEQSAIAKVALLDRLRKMEERYAEMAKESATLKLQIADLNARLHAEAAASVYRKVADQAAQEAKKRKPAVIGAHNL